MREEILVVNELIRVMNGAVLAMKEAMKGTLALHAMTEVTMPATALTQRR